MSVISLPNKLMKEDDCPFYRICLLNRLIRDRCSIRPAYKWYKNLSRENSGQTFLCMLKCGHKKFILVKSQVRFMARAVMIELGGIFYGL